MEFKLHNGSGGLCCKSCGRQDKQLNTYDWLADIPGNADESELVEVQFKNTRKGYFRNSNKIPLEKLLVILHELSLDKGMRELSTGQFAINSVSKEHTNEKLNKVLDYVHFHFSEVIRLADVAKMVNMSEASFCRFIKQHTSKSFIDFLTDIRLGAASRALVDSSLSIAEIGYDCGFNNLSNFNRIFKKKKGVTPKEFRDNYRKNKTII